MPDLSPPVRRRLVVLFAAAAIALPFTAFAKEPVNSKDAPQTLKFAKDSSHVSAKGKLKGPNDIARVYTVELKAGDTCAIAVDDRKAGITFFNVFPPGALQRETEGRTRQEVKASAEGVYTIRVFMTHGAVIKKVSSAYQLTLTKS
jgi:hypothetical protein